MSDAKTFSSWTARAAREAASEDEAGRIGFLVAAYASCGRRGRDAILASAAGVADAHERRRSEAEGGVMRFSPRDGR